MSINSSEQNPQQKSNPISETHTKNLITNLSPFKLSKQQNHTLNKGLTFVPTPKLEISLKDIDSAFENFANRMATRLFWEDFQTTNNKILPHRKSFWMVPKTKNENLSYYLKLTHNEITLLKIQLKNHKLKPNMNKNEYKSLKHNNNQNNNHKKSGQSPAGTRRHTDVGSLSLEGRVTDRPNYDVVKASF